MNQSLFDTLVRSRIVRKYEESFPVATGFLVKLVPVHEARRLTPFVLRANPFCNLMARCPEAKEVCNKTFNCILAKAAESHQAEVSCCFAGFTHIAIPVMSGGEHIATLYGGQLKMEAPTRHDFDKVARQLVRLGLGDRLASLEQTWFDTPVITPKQFEAIMYLLETFAARISRYASERILEPVTGEPVMVTRARKFVQDRYAEPITMPDAARHVQMGPSYFSRVFKRSVGVTFTQYLTRFRVEESKSMLVNPTAQIRKVAFQSGFDSISQFNRSFRQYVEMSPTQYRASLEGGDPLVPGRRAVPA